MVTVSHSGYVKWQPVDAYAAALPYVDGDPESQTVSRRDVELGNTTSRGIFVRGLERGEWVAVAGAKTLQEGQKVRLVEQGIRG